MHPSKSMTRVIGGKRYTVSTSTLLASDEYWDGSNFERHGRNAFLYKTRGGAFFTVKLTQWQGELNTIEAVSEDEAKELYESLPEHKVEYEEAFDAIVEEASAGRPSLYGAPLKQARVMLTDDQVERLKARGGIGENVRRLIDSEPAITTALQNALAYLNTGDLDAVRACISEALEVLGADPTPGAPSVDSVTASTVEGVRDDDRHH